MALPNEWVKHGYAENPNSYKMFGRQDWDYLRDTKKKSAATVIGRLWDNQTKLAQIHKPGQGGLFDEIQGVAQSDARSAGWNKTSGVGSWNYGIWGGRGFGEADATAAEKMGASPYQVRQIYQRAKQSGLRTSSMDTIAATGNRWPKYPSWVFGAHGGSGFGRLDLADMESAGWSLDQVKDARQFASDQNLTIAPEVGSWIDTQQEVADNEAEWKTNLQNQLSDLTAQINEPVEKPGVGYSASSVVGKGGTRMARLQTADRGSRGGTKRWKRSSWSMPTVNTGGTSGKASNSSPVNV